MTGEAHQKVTAGHLRRNAYLYVRQSTIRQVFENTESTKRQYALRQHAIALGWPAEGRFLIKSLAENSPHYPGRISEGRTAWIQIRAQVGAGSAGTRDSGAERPAGKHAFSFRILAN